MKIKKIIDICKRTGIMYTYEGETEQWLSNGHAAYPLYGMPRYTDESICAAYDIDEKKASKMSFCHYDGLPSHLKAARAEDIASELDFMQVAERLDVSLFSGGKHLIPFQTSRGISFVDFSYMAPFADMASDMIVFFEQQDTNGQTFFLVRAGLMLVGLIYPEDIINTPFVERLDMLCSQCRRTLISTVNRNEEGEDYA